MTKQRHCFVTQVGDAIEALASALDPQRKPPFKGDILDLLEWAEKDVLEMRAECDELRQHVTLLRDAIVAIWTNPNWNPDTMPRALIDQLQTAYKGELK